MDVQTLDGRPPKPTAPRGRLSSDTAPIANTVKSLADSVSPHTSHGGATPDQHLSFLTDTPTMRRSTTSSQSQSHQLLDRQRPHSAVPSVTLRSDKSRPMSSNSGVDGIGVHSPQFFSNSQNFLLPPSRPSSASAIALHDKMFRTRQRPASAMGSSASSLMLASSLSQAVVSPRSEGVRQAAASTGSEGGWTQMDAEQKDAPAQQQEEEEGVPSSAATRTGSPETGAHHDITRRTTQTRRSVSIPMARNIEASSVSGEWTLQRVRQRLGQARVLSDGRHFTQAMELLLSLQMRMEDDFFRETDGDSGELDRTATLPIPKEQRQLYAEAIGREIQRVAGMWTVSIQGDAAADTTPSGAATSPAQRQQRAPTTATAVRGTSDRHKQSSSVPHKFLRIEETDDSAPSPIPTHRSAAADSESSAAAAADDEASISEVAPEDELTDYGEDGLFEDRVSSPKPSARTPRYAPIGRDAVDAVSDRSVSAIESFWDDRELGPGHNVPFLPRKRSSANKKRGLNASSGSLGQSQSSMRLSEAEEFEVIAMDILYPKLNKRKHRQRKRSPGVQKPPSVNMATYSSLPEDPIACVQEEEALSRAEVAEVVPVDIARPRLTKKRRQRSSGREESAQPETTGTSPDVDDNSESESDHDEEEHVNEYAVSEDTQTRGDEAEDEEEIRKALQQDLERVSSDALHKQEAIPPRSATPTATTPTALGRPPSAPRSRRPSMNSKLNNTEPVPMRQVVLTPSESTEELGDEEVSPYVSATSSENDEHDDTATANSQNAAAQPNSTAEQSGVPQDERIPVLTASAASPMKEAVQRQQVKPSRLSSADGSSSDILQYNDIEARMAAYQNRSSIASAAALGSQADTPLKERSAVLLSAIEYSPRKPSKVDSSRKHSKTAADSVPIAQDDTKVSAERDEEYPRAADAEPSSDSTKDPEHTAEGDYDGLDNESSAPSIHSPAAHTSAPTPTLQGPDDSGPLTATEGEENQPGQETSTMPPLEIDEDASAVPERNASSVARDAEAVAVPSRTQSSGSDSNWAPLNQKASSDAVSPTKKSVEEGGSEAARRISCESVTSDIPCAKSSCTSVRSNRSIIAAVVATTVSSRHSSLSAPTAGSGSDTAGREGSPASAAGDAAATRHKKDSIAMGSQVETPMGHRKCRRMTPMPTTEHAQLQSATLPNSDAANWEDETHAAYDSTKERYPHHARPIHIGDENLAPLSHDEQHEGNHLADPMETPQHLSGAEQSRPETHDARTADPSRRNSNSSKSYLVGAAVRTQDTSVAATRTSVSSSNGPRRSSADETAVPFEHHDDQLSMINSAVDTPHAERSTVMSPMASTEHARRNSKQLSHGGDSTHEQHIALHEEANDHSPPASLDATESKAMTLQDSASFPSATSQAYALRDQEISHHLSCGGGSTTDALYRSDRSSDTGVDSRRPHSPVKDAEADAECQKEISRQLSCGGGSTTDDLYRSDRCSDAAVDSRRPHSPVKDAEADAECQKEISRQLSCGGGSTTDDLYRSDRCSDAGVDSRRPHSPVKDAQADAECQKEVSRQLSCGGGSTTDDLYRSDRCSDAGVDSRRPHSPVKDAEADAECQKEISRQLSCGGGSTTDDLYRSDRCSDAGVDGKPPRSPAREDATSPRSAKADAECQKEISRQLSCGGGSTTDDLYRSDRCSDAGVDGKPPRSPAREDATSPRSAKADAECQNEISRQLSCGGGSTTDDIYRSDRCSDAGVDSRQPHSPVKEGTTPISSEAAEADALYEKEASRHLVGDASSPTVVKHGGVSESGSAALGGAALGSGEGPDCQQVESRHLSCCIDAGSPVNVITHESGSECNSPCDVMATSQSTQKPSEQNVSFGKECQDSHSTHAAAQESSSAPAATSGVKQEAANVASARKTQVKNDAQLVNGKQMDSNAQQVELESVSQSDSIVLVDTSVDHISKILTTDIDSQPPYCGPPGRWIYSSEAMYGSHRNDVPERLIDFSEDAQAYYFTNPASSAEQQRHSAPRLYGFPPSAGPSGEGYRRIKGYAHADIKTKPPRKDGPAPQQKSKSKLYGAFDWSHSDGKSLLAPKEWLKSRRVDRTTDSPDPHVVEASAAPSGDSDAVITKMDELLSRLQHTPHVPDAASDAQRADKIPPRKPPVSAFAAAAAAVKSVARNNGRAGSSSSNSNSRLVPSGRPSSAAPHVVGAREARELSLSETRSSTAHVSTVEGTPNISSQRGRWFSDEPLILPR